MIGLETMAERAYGSHDGKLERSICQRNKRKLKNQVFFKNIDLLAPRFKMKYAWISFLEDLSFFRKD